MWPTANLVSIPWRGNVLSLEVLSVATGYKWGQLVEME